MTDLLDNMKKTSKARFSAHRRLNAHNYKSLLMIIFYSTVLLLTPISELAGFKVDQSLISDNAFKLIQISLALVILIYSSIIAYANFSVRAEKFHQCGLEINYLIREYDINKSNNNLDELSISEKYNEILKRYDNHLYLDYINSKKIKDVEYYKLNILDNINYIMLFSLLVVYVLTMVKSVI